MKPQETQRTAENSFIREAKTLEELAAELNVGVRTLARWSRKGDWVKRRAEWQHESPQAALYFLKKQRGLQIAAISKTEGPADPAAIDALNKITLIIEKLESRVEAIGPMLDALYRYAQFVGANADADERAVIHKWTEKFLDEERRRHS